MANLGRVPNYHKLSPSELKALGESPKSEQYLTPDGERISKRQYLQIQREHFGVTLGKVSLERFREQQAAAGVPSPRNIYQRAIRNFARRNLHKRVDRSGKRGTIKPGRVISDEEFQILWRTFNRYRHRKGRDAQRVRSRALLALGFFRVEHGQWAYVGDGSTSRAA